MENPLTEKLKLNPQEKAQAGSMVGRLKSIAGFFSDAVDAFKDTSVASAVAQAAPWAGAAGAALSETVPPVKFALELFKGLTEEHEPDALGFLAATLAYQRSVEQTVASIESPSNAKKAGGEVKKSLRDAEPSSAVEMRKFSFKNANEHPFVTGADEALRVWVQSVGYGDAQYSAIQLGVHRRFVSNLKTILSHGELKERFAPFTQRMDLGTDEEQAYDALLEHAEQQRRLFEEAPVFEKEPFALEHVYVDTACGALKWGDINKEQHAPGQVQGKGHDRVDPFSEKWGGRRPLIETVMGLIGDPKLKDAIVVQGVAGSGKSSFTLKLCSELIREGLHPIRVRLRDINLSRPVVEALPRALFPTDRYGLPDAQAGPRPDDLFLGGAIFKERTLFRGTPICPYVLILDGWDEISISATTGFKVRVTNMLSELRSEYLRGRPVPVRVILTGRPSDAVSESKFLLESTDVLTMRPLHPEQVRELVGKLKRALEERPIRVEVKDEKEVWSITDTARFDAVVESYKEDFDATLKASQEGGAPAPDAGSAPAGSMAVLGLPLLTHLAVRLMSRWKGEDLTPLIRNPTTLYRSLVDLTCEKGGASPFDLINIGEQFRITGAQLRELLWKTATAMTAYGQESISFVELALRLNLDVEDLDHRINSATEDHVLSQLMISFFFKGGQRHLGCEFLHKSFREYLYAEGVVEVLKAYGRKVKAAPAEREQYWADFAPTDSRHDFSRELSEALAPQWLSPEVAGHLEQLIKWEIGRAGGREEAEAIGTRTEPLSPAGWAVVRDGLADLWDWWGEGVHLRPPVTVEKRMRVADFKEKTYAQELVELCAPFDPSQRNYSLEPKRTVTVDSHLGDALIRLCAWVHYEVAVNTGWLEGRDRDTPGALPAQIWAGVSLPGEGPRKYQSIVSQQTGEWVIFAPSGEDTRFLTNFAHRIDSAGWRPRGSFPSGVNLSGVDLRETHFFVSALTPGTVWTHANISGANYSGGVFSANTMTEVMAERASFTQAFLSQTALDGSNLDGCFFGYSMLSMTSLKKASLRRARFRGAELEDTNVEEADLTGADFGGTRWERTDLSKAIGVSAEYLPAVDAAGMGGPDDESPD